MGETGLAEILQVVSGGGNLALVVCAAFIYKAVDRLARIETLLSSILNELNIREPKP